jgi:hypothetical protein
MQFILFQPLGKLAVGKGISLKPMTNATRSSSSAHSAPPVLAETQLSLKTPPQYRLFEPVCCAPIGVVPPREIGPVVSSSAFLDNALYNVIECTF